MALKVYTEHICKCVKYVRRNRREGPFSLHKKGEMKWLETRLSLYSILYLFSRWVRG